MHEHGRRLDLPKTLDRMEPTLSMLENQPMITQKRKRGMFLLAGYKNTQWIGKMMSNVWWIEGLILSYELRQNTLLLSIVLVVE